MTPAGSLIAQLCEDFAAASPATIYRRLNIAYQDIAARVAWHDMRRTITLTFPSDGSGVLLPANLLGILCLYDSIKGIFQPRPQSGIQIAPPTDAVYANFPPWSPITYLNGDYTDTMYRYAFSQSTTDALVVGTGATVNEGSGTISGIAGDYTGEFIVFSGRQGFYQFTNATTITPVFMEDTVQNGAYQIRPAGTRRIIAYNPDGTAYSGTVQLDYWIRPQPITDPSQSLLLPATEPLAIMVYVAQVGMANIDPMRASQIQARLDTAMNNMIAMNPCYMAPTSPMAADGEQGMSLSAASPT